MVYNFLKRSDRIVFFGFIRDIVILIKLNILLSDIYFYSVLVFGNKVLFFLGV